MAKKTPTTTMTIRLDEALRDKLDRLTDLTRRSRSFLAAEAVRVYVERELDIMGGIAQGLSDIDAGRVIPHDEAMREIDRLLASARKDRK